ncbi:MAG: hypothetical protein IAE79_17615 [Anaerolinea sp.]|nr:hypothetical protein [Anaerolinea sp.]
MNNWIKPRKELIPIAVMLVQRGAYGGLELVCSNLVRDNYTGSRPKTVTKNLMRDAVTAGALRPASRRDDVPGPYQMARELEAEGWKYLEEDGGERGGFWFHEETWSSVNNLGGYFSTFGEATRRAHGSAVREMVRKEMEARHAGNDSGISIRN